MDGHNVAIIIPAFNEDKTIGRVIERASKWGVVVVVDDASTDDTVSVSQKSGATLLRQELNCGYDSAIELGFRYASEHGFQVVITLDADGQHDPSCIPLFIEKIESGFNMVLGVRSSVSRFSEKLYGFIGEIFWGVHDPLCGFKAYRIELFNQLGYFDSYKSIGTNLMIYAISCKEEISEISINIANRVDDSRFGNSISVNLRILKSLILGIKKYMYYLKMAKN